MILWKLQSRRQNIAHFNAVAAVDDRDLVDAGALVGTHELCDDIVVDIAVIGRHANEVCADALNNTCAFAQDADAGVNA